MQNKKRSFFERLTGSIRMEEDESEDTKGSAIENKKNGNWMEQETAQPALAVHVHQTATDLMIQTMVAGVKPENLDLNIARDMITIAGRREENRNIDEENYFIKELYWGKFSRTISLPHEVEPEEAEATERHGLLTIRLQKVDKEKKANIKVKSL